ncbi:MAG: hypothetical protein M1812_004107 [Candelaria pacifica]|nr:MAG: hypothetical protein M1812_004107 [Candelaria pacifica]
MGSIGQDEAAVAQDNLVIPLIDFSLFLHGSSEEKLSTAQSILDGFKTAGFIYLKNHGLSRDTVAQVFDESARFFDRPKEQKVSLSWTTPQSNRGYVAYGREKVLSENDRETIAKIRALNPDLKESMEIGREGVPGLPNNWPDRFDAQGEAFKGVMQEFWLKCHSLQMEVMRSMALGLGLQLEFFDEYVDGGDNNLRLLHYPAVEKSVFTKNKGQVRAGEHSDYGSITLLFQDDRGGLQVLSPDGTFVNATPIPDTIVVNAGDLMARWSNNTIKSTKHRVVEPPIDGGNNVHPARYSVAYFCNPNYGKSIEAIPGTWEQEGKKYEAINAGEYLFQRLAATY